MNVELRGFLDFCISRSRAGEKEPSTDWTKGLVSPTIVMDVKTQQDATRKDCDGRDDEGKTSTCMPITTPGRPVSTPSLY
jgi:hypothetical protein